jgi:chromosome segregation ATPase
MALRILLNAHYPFVHRIDTTLPAQVEDLKRENANLRARLVEAHEGKAGAVRQAEQLRAEKERLRSRVAALKKELTDSALRYDQMLKKLNELQTSITSLEEQLKARKKPPPLGGG